VITDRERRAMAWIGLLAAVIALAFAISRPSPPPPVVHYRFHGLPPAGVSRP
jgi:hypothetical protein